MPVVSFFREKRDPFTENASVSCAEANVCCPDLLIRTVDSGGMQGTGWIRKAGAMLNQAAMQASN